MEQSPSWEANRFSATQEIPRILCNPQVFLPNSQKPVPTLSYTDSVHAPIPLLEDPF
jgi:hypothetical protein